MKRNEIIFRRYPLSIIGTTIVLALGLVLGLKEYLDLYVTVITKICPNVPNFFLSPLIFQNYPND